MDCLASPTTHRFFPVGLEGREEPDAASVHVLVLVYQDVVVVALELGPHRFIALEEEHRPHD